MEFCPDPKFHGIPWNFFHIPSSMMIICYLAKISQKRYIFHWLQYHNSCFEHIQEVFSRWLRPLLCDLRWYNKTRGDVKQNVKGMHCTNPMKNSREIGSLELVILMLHLFSLHQKTDSHVHAGSRRPASATIQGTMVDTLKKN